MKEAVELFRREGGEGKLVAGGMKVCLGDREDVARDRAELLRRAHESGDNATDDAALVEAMGGSVVVVPGEAANIKITTAEDLAGAELLLSGHDADAVDLGRA